MSDQQQDASAGGTGAPPEPSHRNRAPDLTREYRNQHITVRWYARRCIHSAECIRRAPRVFNPARRPWIDLTQADTDQIIRAVEACPTGALEYVATDRREQPPALTQIQAVRGGPLYVRGAITICDESGQIIREGTRVALCRCGKSRNMPFCDNSHRAGDGP